MHKFSILLLVLSSTHGFAFAQDTSGTNGKWSATFQGNGGGAREAELLLTDTGGVWRDLARGNQAKNNKCIGKEYPIAFEIRSASELAFEVKASTVMQGCSDLTITAKSTDGKVFDGVIKDGTPVRLVRQ